MCRCIGGLAPGSNRIINAVRLVGGSDHNSFIRTPGIVPIGAPGIASFHLMSVGLIIRERVLSAMAASSGHYELCRSLWRRLSRTIRGVILARAICQTRASISRPRAASHSSPVLWTLRAHSGSNRRIFNHLVDYVQDAWYLWSTNEWRSRNGRT